MEDLDLHLITFKNGVRLNLKKTNFEAGRIRLSARVGSGGITEPREQSGLAALTSATFNSGGLGKHSADDLRQILAGRNISAQFQVAPDAFTFSGVTTPDDLVLQFQFLTAALTDPGYRPEALRQAQKGIEQLYLSFKHTANGPLATEIANLLASGDQRFGLPSREEMLARNLEEVRAWLAPHFAQGALEVALVGDLDLEATIAAATRTIGALPPREPKPALEPLKKVAFPAKPFAQKFPIESEIPKGTLLLYWPTDDGIDVRRNRRFSLLTAILNDRMREKVREEIGGTYSPRAASNASDVFPGYGYITASIDVEPAAADKMAGLVIGLADDLAKKGVTPDELKRARLPLLTAMRESLRDNGYWLGAVLDNAQERPEVLDWARTRQEDIEGITAEELSALAKKYLGRAQVSARHHPAGSRRACLRGTLFSVSREQIAIVGGGAAGFFAAIACAQARPENEVHLYEAGSQFLTKVRISGGGRCNVTHTALEPRVFAARYPRGERALLAALPRFSATDTARWFERRGVRLKTEEDGRLFPVTDSSGTVIDCLLFEAESAGVKLHPRCGVEAVQRTADGFLLRLASGAEAILRPASPRHWRSARGRRSAPGGVARSHDRVSSSVALFFAQPYPVVARAFRHRRSRCGSFRPGDETSAAWAGAHHAQWRERTGCAPALSLGRPPALQLGLQIPAPPQLAAHLERASDPNRDASAPLHPTEAPRFEFAHRSATRPPLGKPGQSGRDQLGDHLDAARSSGDGAADNFAPAHRTPDRWEIAEQR